MSGGALVAANKTVAAQFSGRRCSHGDRTAGWSVTVLVVRRTLGTTAAALPGSRVATMPLTTWDHRITDRVAEPDTHPE